MSQSRMALLCMLACVGIVTVLAFPGCTSRATGDSASKDDDAVNDVYDDIGDDDVDDGDTDDDAPSACEETLAGEVDACFEGLTAGEVCGTADADCWVECFEHTSGCSEWALCVESVCVNGEDPWWNDDDTDDDDTDDDDSGDDDAGDDDTGDDDTVADPTLIGSVKEVYPPTPVANAQLDFYSATARDETPIATTTTSASGDYALTIPAGWYSVVVTPPEETGLAVAKYEIEVLEDNPTPPFADLFVNDCMEDDQVRIALHWGDTPSDLDSHLLAPCPDPDPGACGGLGFYLMYFAARQWGSHFSLDVDDTTGNGPEVTTVNSGTAGTYRFAVHDYSNIGSTSSRAMSLSAGLQVTVFHPDGNTVFRPDGETPGTVWMVVDLDYDGSEWTLSEVNDWCFESNISNVFEACP
ncbi:MAG: hypothetical protein IT350_13070 [Deltaproteobacteria bacterium]|nr:hypothetical protein [Deltaproteobacteria bacterium]